MKESSANTLKVDQFTFLKNKNILKRRQTVKKITTKKVAENIRYGLNIFDNISRLKHLDGKISLRKEKKSIENIHIFTIDGKFNFIDILSYLK